MSCFFPRFDKKCRLYLKIFLISLAIFIGAIVSSGCKAIKSVGSFFTSTTEKAAQTTGEIIDSIPSGVPVDVNHNLDLNPDIIIFIIMALLALLARYLINRHVNRKKSNKK